MSKIAKRYAQALISAVGLAASEDLCVFLKSLSNTIENNKTLKSTLLNPAVNLTEKKAVLLNICELIKKNPVSQNIQNGEVIFNSTANLIDLLISKSRLSNLTEIVEFLDKLIKQYKKALSVTFISAKRVTAEQIVKLESKLTADYGNLAKVKWELAPELIGGAKIVVDDAIIDNSILAKLNAMKESLMKDL